MGIFSNLFGERPSASPDSVQFDASGYQFQGDRDGARVWFLAEGGGVGLYFFPRKPDLPVNAATVEQIKESYVAQMGSGLKMVECRVVDVDGVNSIWLVAKGQDEQSRAAIYVGSLTIPFREFSFVVKVQCAEQGVTGMREALLMAEALSKGTGKVEGDRFVPSGWSFDDEQFDERVPKHPLSRVRKELRHIASTLRIDPKIKKAARFALPESEGGSGNSRD